MTIRTFLLFTIVFLLIGSAAHAQFVKSDTTFFLREYAGGDYHIIYIDTTKSSKYYNLIANFKFGEFDSVSYSQSLEYLKEKNKSPLQKQKITGISRKWCPLYIYKGNYYLWTPLDWGWNFGCVKITDSTWIDFGGEGAEARKINSFKTIDKNTFQLNYTRYYDTTKESIDIHILDKEKGIALFGNTLMVSADKIKLYPIIVDESSRKTVYLQGKYPVKFDKPDLSFLFVIKTDKLAYKISDPIKLTCTAPEPTYVISDGRCENMGAVQPLPIIFKKTNEGFEKWNKSPMQMDCGLGQVEIATAYNFSIVIDEPGVYKIAFQLGNNKYVYSNEFIVK